VLERSEDVLDGTPPQCHRVQVSVKTPLHGLDHRLVFPASHAAFVARGALSLDRALRTDMGPVRLDLESGLDVGLVAS